MNWLYGATRSRPTFSQEPISLSPRIGGIPFLEAFPLAMV
jgi:hypothetical protein